MVRSDRLPGLALVVGYGPPKFPSEFCRSGVMHAFSSGGPVVIQPSIHGPINYEELRIAQPEAFCAIHVSWTRTSGSRPDPGSSARNGTIHGGNPMDSSGIYLESKRWMGMKTEPSVEKSWLGICAVIRGFPGKPVQEFALGVRSTTIVIKERGGEVPGRLALAPNTPTYGQGDQR
jgi:hypothetical protein